MQLALIPPRRVPTKRKVLIKLHQVASVKNAGTERVHSIAALPERVSRREFLEEGPEPFRGTRHIVLGLSLLHASQ